MPSLAVRLKQLSALEKGRMAHYIKYNKMKFFKPLKWQEERLFVDVAVRGVLAANRTGKSYGGSYETALHLTGDYPAVWNGARFDEPIDALVLGYDFMQMQRPQAILELLFGEPNDIGSGFIPKDKIVESRKRQGGCIDKMWVRHKSGGVSTVSVASYEQGDSSFQGGIFHFILIDEQPRNNRILPQALKRQWSLKGDGRLLAVFTPELGLNDTAAAFWDKEGIHHSGLINVSLYDLVGDLYTQEEVDAMVAVIPPWQREFSVYGRPSAGTGAVFQGINKQSLVEVIPEVPDDWKQLISIDLGFQDNCVISHLAEHPINKELWLVQEKVFSQTDAVIIASFVRSMQQGFIPLLLPKDAKFERGLGETYQSIFKGEGCIVVNELAANWRLQPNGKNSSISAGIMYLRDLMQKGLFKVTQTATEFLKEFDLYSYNEQGKFIDKHNHAIDSVRYGSQGISRFGVSKLEASSANDLDWETHLAEVAPL
jgi:phage terminase large subunit-like protein